METENSRQASKRDLVDRIVAELEQVVGAPFSLWEKTAFSAWQRVSRDDCSQSPAMELLDLAQSSQKPTTRRSRSGTYDFAVPLLCNRFKRIKKVAVCQVEVADPRMLCRLAEAVVAGCTQQQEIDCLTEENAIFLRQVSEGFEELSFLRAMAEQLVFGTASKDYVQLVQLALPALGEAVGVEILMFLPNDAQQDAHADNAWHVNQRAKNQLHYRDGRELVRQFREAAGNAPVVRNNFQATHPDCSLPGIDSFILVELSTTSEVYGWLLAINRIGTPQEAVHQPICKLSQNELGTNEASLINTAAAMLASHAHNLVLLNERESLLFSVVRTLVSAIDSRDPYTCGHSERVARYGKRLAESLGYEKEACQRIYMTGLLHDIGKIGVSDAVLNKAGALTDAEYAEIQRHTDFGWAILHDLEQLQYVLPGVLYHHERFDGRGYPDGLAGRETPLDGRLLAVVDAFDAMTSNRPYRLGMPVEQAVGILQDGAGSQWDAELVEAFMRILPEILQIRDNYERSPMPQRIAGEAASAGGALGKQDPKHEPQPLMVASF